MQEAKINEIIETVIRDLIASGSVSNFHAAPNVTPAVQTSQTFNAATTPAPTSDIKRSNQSVSIDLPDPTSAELRFKSRVINPKDPTAINELIRSTSARIGVGRAGVRYNTASLLLFQGDHAVTQDALYREIDQGLLDEFNLFTVQTNISEGKEQFLLRPDLGRQLNGEAKRTLSEKCIKNPNIQLVIGDGLSTTAIEANLRQIFPILKQGFAASGLTLGTPFYVKYCRVGVINDIGDVIKPDVLILLIGERPGLGRADSMSAYMGYRPKNGNNDADRDVICNIFENGGTNPLEAGAFIVQVAQKMIHYQASGVKLKLVTK